MKVKAGARVGMRMGVRVRLWVRVGVRVNVRLWVRVRSGSSMCGVAFQRYSPRSPTPSPHALYHCPQPSPAERISGGALRELLLTWFMGGAPVMGRSSCHGIYDLYYNLYYYC